MKLHGKLQEFLEEFVPNIKERLIHYPGERPIFDLYNVEEDIQRALADACCVEVRSLFDD